MGKPKIDGDYVDFGNWVMSKNLFDGITEDSLNEDEIDALHIEIVELINKKGKKAECVMHALEIVVAKVIIKGGWDTLVDLTGFAHNVAQWVYELEGEEEVNG